MWNVIASAIFLIGIVLDEASCCMLRIYSFYRYGNGFAQSFVYWGSRISKNDLNSSDHQIIGWRADFLGVMRRILLHDKDIHFSRMYN